MRAVSSLLKYAAALTILVLTVSGAFAEQQSIQWSALRPVDQSNANLPLPGLAASRAQGETLAWRNETQAVALTGFILPIDRDGDLVYEFMLVPWAGACSHSAPPPPNQLVRVVPEQPFPISKVYEVVTVSGVLQPGIDKTQLFIMDGARVLEFGYSMTRARVTKTANAIDPDLHSASPFGVAVH